MQERWLCGVGVWVPLGPGDNELMDCVIEFPEKYKLFVLFIFLFLLCPVLNNIHGECLNNIHGEC